MQIGILEGWKLEGLLRFRARRVKLIPSFGVWELLVSREVLGIVSEMATQPLGSIIGTIGDAKTVDADKSALMSPVVIIRESARGWLSPSGWKRALLPGFPSGVFNILFIFGRVEDHGDVHFAVIGSRNLVSGHGHFLGSRRRRAFRSW
jgi:hypothetical protein